MDNDNGQHNGTLDPFDRRIGALEGMPSVVKSKPTTLRTAAPISGAAETWIVQTYRQRDDSDAGTVVAGDTIFVEYVRGGVAVRIALPPAVAATIARQRDALTGKNRSRAAKDVAERNKAAGVLPGFMRGRKGGRK